MLELPQQALRIAGEFGRILRINPRVRCCRIAGWPGAERTQIVWRDRQRNHRQWAGVMFAIERRWLGDIEPAWRGIIGVVKPEAEVERVGGRQYCLWWIGPRYGVSIEAKDLIQQDCLD